MHSCEVPDLLVADATNDVWGRARVTLAYESTDSLTTHRRWLERAEPALSFASAPWRESKRLPCTDVVVLAPDREARQAVDWAARLRLGANFALLYISPPDGWSAFGTVDPIRADLATRDAAACELSIRLARLAQAQHRSLGTIGSRVCSEGPYTLVMEERALYLNGRRLRLTELQFRIAVELFTARWATVARERLMCHVRSRDPLAALAVHVSQLRRRLCLDEHGYAILPVPKQGYRLCPKDQLVRPGPR